MKLLFTLLMLTAIVFGLYHVTMAVYGWFQMSSIVDEVTKEELARVRSASSEPRERFGHIRERILKGAKEADVDLRAENLHVDIVDNMVDVRLSWDAPIVVYGGKAYLEVPMTMQQAFPIRAR